MDKQKSIENMIKDYKAGNKDINIFKTLTNQLENILCILKFYKQLNSFNDSYAKEIEERCYECALEYERIALEELKIEKSKKELEKKRNEIMNDYSFINLAKASKKVSKTVTAIQKRINKGDLTVFFLQDFVDSLFSDEKALTGSYENVVNNFQNESKHELYKTLGKELKKDFHAIDKTGKLPKDEKLVSVRQLKDCSFNKS